MADTKLSAMTANTAPATGDLLYLLDDPGGTPTDNKITHQNLLKINNLTADATPDGTADVLLTYDNSAATPKKVTTGLVGPWVVSCVGGAGSFNPADATSYYWAVIAPSFVPSTSSGTRNSGILRTGTLTTAWVRFNCTAGTSETSTLAIRINDTTDNTITSAINLSASSYTELKTGLSVAVTAGNTFEMKWTTPTWVTNPTAVLVEVTLLFV